MAYSIWIGGISVLRNRSADRGSRAAFLCTPLLVCWVVVDFGVLGVGVK